MIESLIAKDHELIKSIVVIGDAMLDHYIHGRLEIGQEGCQKFIEESRIAVPGGAANAARTLENWKAKTHLISASVDTVKKRFMVDGKTVFRHDFDHVVKQDESQCKECLAKLKYRRPDAVLISDYDKGFMSPKFIRDVIAYCKERNIPCIADAKREPSIYRGAILKCNIDYARKFDVNLNKFPTYVITHGANTPSMWETEHMVLSIMKSSSIVECINHVGAGDAFAAHLTLALAHGFSLNDAAAIGHSAGRVYVQYPHNRPPYPHEIRRDMTGSKLVYASELPALRKSIKHQLVFTNGVFRLPHAGHAWLLDWASKQGGKLVVGMNSDESTRDFVMPFEERVAMLSAMECVDWIVGFDSETPEPILEKLNADILVKGPEYFGQAIPGSRLVREVRIAPPSPWPKHATNIIQTMTTMHQTSQPDSM